ncbi:uncharacterized protein [Rutidosis leptorrhynchoides]|uniref:uncharacterized protein n=1 Tax=Rutidosis leptorrhynchoides TaxID=125765 RepID=UPI003A99E31D
MISHSGDYILMGDWNAVRVNEERCGTDFCHHDARVFNDFIDSNSLYEVPLGSVLAQGYSDHSPILLFKDKVDFGPTYFKIFESWFARPDFEDTVRNAWSDIVDRDMDIVAKFRVLKARIADEVLINDRNNLCNERDDISKLVNLDVLQKSRVKWDVEGDKNSKFFHCSLKHKRGSQQIQGLMVDGSWIVDPNRIKEKFHDHFKEKFDSHYSGADFLHVDPHYKLSVDEAKFLERDVDDVEIKRAVWDCGSSKAPGPDGISFRFIKFFWDIFQVEIAKVDFEKAYDSVSWDYLFFMLKSLGFGETWCAWIMGCLDSAKTSVLVNGSPTREFLIKKGPRQGDPLSPFLFIIVMEGLHLALHCAMESNFIRGVNVVSGLRINVMKSHVFGIGVDDNEVSRFASMSASRNSSVPAPVSPSAARRRSRQPRLNDPVNYYMATITHMTRTYTPETRIDALSDCMRVLPHVERLDEIQATMDGFISFKNDVEFGIRKHNREVDAKFEALESEICGLKV